MFVIGATRASELKNIRKIVPDHFLLIPGVGAQGGSLKDVSEYGLNKDTSTVAHCGLLVNASRAIIYASQEKNFEEAVKKVAQEYQKEMSNYLK
jgi:orotidine-5'-phosphate decarboxylase